MTLSNSKFLNTPTLAIELIDTGIVICDIPVCADNSVICIFLTEKISDDIFAEAVTDVLSRWIDACRDCVIWHHCRSLDSRACKLERALSEWFEMCLECTTWINCIFTIIIVCVTATLFWSAAWPMLNHCVDTLVSPTAADFILACTGLETVNICARHICIKFWAFAECTIETCPTWLCSEVDLRRKSSCDTKCTIFFCCNAAELLNEGRIECRGHTERCRPVRNLATCTIVILSSC